MEVDWQGGELRYTVDNPGLFTYQVHSHAGRVKFLEQANGKVEMLWEVDVRPLRGWRGVVLPFTEAIVSTISRNLKAHLAEPCARVGLPGRRDMAPFGSVPLESWFGGVLAAQRADCRPAWEQAAAFLQPWTWGRSADSDGESDGWSVVAASDTTCVDEK